MMRELLHKILNLIIARLKRIPPFRVYTQQGLSRQFWINLALTWLGYWPGELHALWLSHRDEQDDMVPRSTTTGAAFAH